MSTNTIVKSIFEILGDKVPGGYALPVGDELIPLHLNKDFKAEYPEIRVAPFTRKKDAFYDKYIESKYRDYKYWQSGSNQVDMKKRMDYIKIKHMLCLMMSFLRIFMVLELMILY